MNRLALFFVVVFGLCAAAPAVIKRDPREVLVESQEAFAKKDFKRAVELLTQAIEGSPELAPAYILRGLAQGALGKYDESIEDISKAITLAPGDPRTLLIRAGTYEAKKQFDKAIGDYSEAIRLSPRDAEIYSSRGFCHAQDENEDKALADFEKALELDPKNLRAIQLRGTVHGQKGQKDKALADFKRAIDLDSNNPATYLWRAQLYLVENEPELALADFEEVMRRAPGYAGALNDYAWTLATNPKDSVRDGRKAVDFAKKACYETDYKHAPAVDTLAAAYAEAGEWDEAVKWQEEAVSLAGKSHPDDLPGMKERVTLFKEKKPFREQPKREKKKKP